MSKYDGQWVYVIVRSDTGKPIAKTDELTGAYYANIYFKREDAERVIKIAGLDGYEVDDRVLV